MKHREKLMWALVLSVVVSAARVRTVSAQTPAVQTVRGRVEVTSALNTSGITPRAALAARAKIRHDNVPATVVWLTAASGSDVQLDPPSPGPAANARLVQRNKSFEPRLLVVPAGSQVEFPNRDPFFHNVFSLFEGKRFDLGLYEAGTSRTVRFDRPGISYIFCNIHPEMNAVVITMSTPLYAIASGDGQLSIPNVPSGRYTLHIWSEGMGPENDKGVTREITIGENSASLGVIPVPEANGQRMAHKNKYGREYDQPAPDNSIYQQH